MTSPPNTSLIARLREEATERAWSSASVVSRSFALLLEAADALAIREQEFFAAIVAREDAVGDAFFLCQGATPEDERARIVKALRDWAKCMGEQTPDNEAIADAWKAEIDAACTFASQIESGTL